MKITEFGQFEVHAFRGQTRRIITTKWLPLSIAIIYMDYDIDKVLIKFGVSICYQLIDRISPLISIITIYCNVNRESV